jgi:hypothetical protein
VRWLLRARRKEFERVTAVTGHQIDTALFATSADLERKVKEGHFRKIFISAEGRDLHIRPYGKEDIRPSAISSSASFPGERGPADYDRAKTLPY